LEDEMKRHMRILLWVVGGLFAIVLGLVANEVVIFVASTEMGARDEAKRDFVSECARRGLDPNEFTGPQRIKSPDRTYGFVWENPLSGNQIATMVRYFPAGVESWLIRDKEHGKFAPYCDEKAPVC
jgi:hypothetical protein